MKLLMPQMIAIFRDYPTFSTQMDHLSFQTFYDEMILVELSGI